MTKPRLLDLFCGAGGAGMGYHQAGFNVTGVDIEPQPRYPFRFIQADALEYLAEHGHEYDVIHASPPCQRYSVITPDKSRHPDLLPVVAEMLRGFGKPYVIENVTGARGLLENPFMLCGTMFGLRVWRHRWFETNVIPPFSPAMCNHGRPPVLITGSSRRGGVLHKDPPVVIRRKAMGIDWMTITELDQAIPPAYTRWIGEQLMRVAIRPNSRLHPTAFGGG